MRWELGLRFVGAIGEAGRVGRSLCDGVGASPGPLWCRCLLPVGEHCQRLEYVGMCCGAGSMREESIYKWLEANKQAIAGREDRAGMSEGGAGT